MNQPEFHSRFAAPSFRYYARIKLATDPVYAAVYERVRETAHPLLDVGCGLGLLAFYLRGRGVRVPITGIDSDREKVEAATALAGGRYDEVRFEVADARDAFVAHRGSSALLDVLHYFTDHEQETMLEAAAERASGGGVVIVRDCIRDASWRYRITHLEESFATRVRWIKARRLNFPTLELIAAPFRARGFSEEILPMWGATPFNNYLLTFRRP